MMPSSESLPTQHVTGSVLGRNVLPLSPFLTKWSSPRAHVAPSLPLEIIDHIITDLDVPDLASFSSASWTFLRIADRHMYRTVSLIIGDEPENSSCISLIQRLATSPHLCSYIRHLKLIINTENPSVAQSIRHVLGFCGRLTDLDLTMCADLFLTVIPASFSSPLTCLRLDQIFTRIDGGRLLSFLQTQSNILSLYLAPVPPDLDIPARIPSLGIGLENGHLFCFNPGPWDHLADFRYYGQLSTLCRALKRLQSPLSSVKTLTLECSWPAFRPFNARKMARSFPRVQVLRLHYRAYLAVFNWKPIAKIWQRFIKRSKTLRSLELTMSQTATTPDMLTQKAKHTRHQAICSDAIVHNVLSSRASLEHIIVFDWAGYWIIRPIRSASGSLTGSYADEYNQ